MKRGRGPSGVLVVDKPRGPTSHDVVGRVRRALHTREVGHAGTLDPMASGVLVVAVGEATRLVPWLVDGRKTYEATVALGVETDTLDAEGQTTHTAPLEPALEEALARGAGDVASQLHEALAVERARTLQDPPIFSAIHQGGERAYAKARRGEIVVLAARPVTVHRLELVACSASPAELRVVAQVSKGYYVRALARDLAASLGTVGHLTSLRRTASGTFGLSEAVPLEAPYADALSPVAVAATRALPAATLTAEGVVDARHGRPVAAKDLASTATGACAWLGPDGVLVAIGEVDAEGGGRVLRGFPERA